MHYDAVEIKATVNLVDLVRGDTVLKRVSGDEHAGPCPKCGGTDRFHVTPSWWFCRQCHELRGDAIEYVRWHEGADFVQACERLGGKAALEGPRMMRTQQGAANTVPAREVEPPGDAWQTAGRAYVKVAQGKLWETPAALDYLRSRGLSDETIRAAGLGWNPQEMWRPGGKWGQDKQVWLPRGWVIPHEADGVLWAINTRRTDADIQAAKAWNAANPNGKPRPDDKYLCVLGSRRILYNLDALYHKSDAAICEGEFDALLLQQHVGRVCGCVALGSATRPPTTAPEIAELVGVRRLWVLLDTDKAGEQGAEKLLNLSARVRKLELPAHDVTDFWREGGDLVAWTLARIGPRAPQDRMRWAEHYMDVLDADAQGNDETAPALRCWLALLEIYNELGRAIGWGKETE